MPSFVSLLRLLQSYEQGSKNGCGVFLSRQSTHESRKLLPHNQLSVDWSGDSFYDAVTCTRLSNFMRRALIARAAPIFMEFEKAKLRALFNAVWRWRVHVAYLRSGHKVSSNFAFMKGFILLRRAYVRHAFCAWRHTADAMTHAFLAMCRVVIHRDLRVALFRWRAGVKYLTAASAWRRLSHAAVAARKRALLKRVAGALYFLGMMYQATAFDVWRMNAAVMPSSNRDDDIPKLFLTRVLKAWSSAAKINVHLRTAALDQRLCECFTAIVSLFEFFCWCAG